MSPRTRFLGRLIGLYSILISLAMVTHTSERRDGSSARAYPPLLLLSGVFAVSVGLAMVLGHNVWSGGALPVVVTLVGWASLVKGLLLLFLPPKAAPGVLLGGLHYEQFFYVYTGVSLLLGIYLTYAAGRRA